jgi:hypothetical protein
MRHAWIALLLVACETTPSSGHPFTPVKVASALEPIVDDGGEPWFDEQPAVIISSEEMDAVLDAEAKGEPMAAPVAEPAAEPAAAPAAETVAAPVVAPAVAVAAVTAPGLAPSQPMVMGGAAWPVRLVRTLPDTLPPRAILGLPDGREIVVTPGSMVPDQGLVVVAIGRQSAQLARVSAQGDHAAIQPMMLNAQY